MYDLTPTNGFGGPAMPIQDGLYSVIFPQVTSLQLLSGFFCGVHLKPLRFAFLLRISNQQDKLQRAVSSFVHRLGVVLTQRSGGSKLERVDSPRKGKGSCKRSNGPLHENLSKKRSSLCDRAINRKPKSHEI